jgi:hypothetical protein
LAQVRDKPLPAEAFYTLLPPIQPPLYDSLQVEPGVSPACPIRALPPLALPQVDV